VTFSLAFAIGFSVASIPGPIIILVVTETLRQGPRAGAVTMMAPVLMDAVVMVPLGLLLQAALFSGRGTTVLGLVGGVFLLWLGLHSIWAGVRGPRDQGLQGSRVTAPTLHPSNPSSLHPFWKGVLTHLTSPYPYLYWGTVGSSFIRQGFENGGVWAAALFPVGFWLGASTFTLLVIYLVARGKTLLPPNFEPLVHHASGALLIGSGIFLALRVWRGVF
jgi:threonine/homoserine/homoserine lactone efflux protein